MGWILIDTADCMRRTDRVKNFGFQGKRDRTSGMFNAMHAIGLHAFPLYLCTSDKIDMQ
jgi:hypothetical protein